MQNVKVTATPQGTDPLLAYSTDPTRSVPNTPPMVGGVWTADLNTGVYFFSLTVTAQGQTACEIVATTDGVTVRDIKYSLPGAPASMTTYTETWMISVA